MSPASAEERTPAPRERIEGYLPIRGYAAIGDQHTVALVGADGSVDWLCLPSFDEPFVLGALLDADRGGRFALAPTDHHAVERRYVPETNVLETTFSTEGGRVKVTDALTLSEAERPVRELARRIEGLEGEVEMAWRVEPRFGHTERPARIDRRDGALVARRDGDAVVVQAWDAGEPVVADGAVRGRFAVGPGASALLTLAATAIADGPLPFTERSEVEARLDHTVAWWRGWGGERTYDGPWREEVLRSALVLKMLVYAPTGAIVAAPTTGLPEAIGGAKNWDYRFSWLRDSSFTVDALMRLGDEAEAGRFFSWLMAASRENHPQLQPFYRLDGTGDIGQRELDVAGYRGSRPVLEGNGAAHQRQLGNYGDLFQAATLYADRGRSFDEETAERLAGIADYVCTAWAHRDSGLWELGTLRHYTASKMLCWSRSTGRRSSRGRESSPTRTPTAGARSPDAFAASSRTAAGQTNATPGRRPGLSGKLQEDRRAERRAGQGLEGDRPQGLRPGLTNLAGRCAFSWTRSARRWPLQVRPRLLRREPSSMGREQTVLSRRRVTVRRAAPDRPRPKGGPMMRRVLLASLTALTVLGLAACGSSSTSSSSSAGPKRIPLAQFVAKGDAACKRAHQKRKAAGPPPRFNLNRATAEQLKGAANYLENDVAATTGELDEIGMFEPSEPGPRKRWLQLVSSLRTKSIPGVQAAAFAARRGEKNVFRAAFIESRAEESLQARRFKQLGFKVCGRG